MDDYFEGSAAWPEGWTKLRVYFVPAAHEIQPLIDIYRPVVEQFSFVAPVPDAWLHETLAVVEGRPTHEITAAELVLLQAQLRERIGALPAFTLVAGGALATQHGLVLDLTPDDDYVVLQRAARAAVADVFGEAAARYGGGRPHIPFAYGAGSGDSGLLQGRLRNVTDRRVTLSVADVRLVDVTQDATRRELRWRELARISLGPQAQSPPPATR
jgi:hypothetical protein